ncbi:MAG: hypothetical protein H6922_06295 [Pseudomonadaceae bacterium]|nr:hypothetical protein [Pseudomonadaceae bacterium]
MDDGRSESGAFPLEDMLQREPSDDAVSLLAREVLDGAREKRLLASNGYRPYRMTREQRADAVRRIQKANGDK